MVLTFHKKSLKRYFLFSQLKRGVDFIIGSPILLLLGFFVKQNKPYPIQLIKKILIVKLAAVGDTVVLSPVVFSIKKKFPHVQIHLLVTPINNTIAKHIPSVDNFFVLKISSLKNILKVLIQIRKEHFDAVFDLEQWSRGSSLISFFSRGVTTVGFNTPGQFRHLAYNLTVSKSSEKHEIEGFFDIINLIIPIGNNRISEVSLVETKSGNSELHKLIRRKLNKNDYKRVCSQNKIVIIHPGCGLDGTPREWPVEKYFSLSTWLIKEYKAFIFFTSGPEEKQKSYILSKLLPFNTIDLGGSLTWEGIISLVNKANLVISGNTGLMHIAAALKKPQVAIHGPTNTKIWGPLNDLAFNVRSHCLKCPCLELGFEYHSYDQSCMNTITVDEVKYAVREVLNRCE